MKDILKKLLKSYLQVFVYIVGVSRVKNFRVPGRAGSEIVRLRVGSGQKLSGQNFFGYLLSKLGSGRVNPSTYMK